MQFELMVTQRVASHVCLIISRVKEIEPGGGKDKGKGRGKQPAKFSIVLTVG